MMMVMPTGMTCMTVVRMLMPGMIMMRVVVMVWHSRFPDLVRQFNPTGILKDALGSSVNISIIDMLIGFNQTGLAPNRCLRLADPSD